MIKAVLVLIHVDYTNIKLYTYKKRKKAQPSSQFDC